MNIIKFKDKIKTRPAYVYTVGTHEEEYVIYQDKNHLDESPVIKYHFAKAYLSQKESITTPSSDYEYIILIKKDNGSGSGSGNGEEFPTNGKYSIIRLNDSDEEKRNTYNDSITIDNDIDTVELCEIVMTQTTSTTDHIIILRYKTIAVPQDHTLSTNTEDYQAIIKDHQGWIVPYISYVCELTKEYWTVDYLGKLYNICTEEPTLLNDGKTEERPDEFYNSKLKGKYVYTINFKYIFPFDRISQYEYIDLTQDEEYVSRYKEYKDYATLLEYNADVDAPLTEEANDITTFEAANEFVTDEDVTLDDIKQFRKWLASSLLSVDRFVEWFAKSHTDYNAAAINAMLEYYKNNMADSATIFISMFAPNSTISLGQPLNVHACGCAGATVQLAGNVSVCDPLTIYTDEIYKYMVKCFSNTSFWDNIYLKNTLVPVFKKYIDNIIKTNLPLYTSIPTQYKECTCVNVSSDRQREYQNMLINLSTSLEYIATNSVSTRKNFIYKSLMEWSTYLYERMYWA